MLGSLDRGIVSQEPRLLSSLTVERNNALSPLNSDMLLRRMPIDIQAKANSSSRRWMPSRMTFAVRPGTAFWMKATA